MFGPTVEYKEGVKAVSEAMKHGIKGEGVLAIDTRVRIYSIGLKLRNAGFLRTADECWNAARRARLECRADRDDSLDDPRVLADLVTILKKARGKGHTAYGTP